MKVQQEDRKFESNTSGASSTFTIAASSKAFQILSDQLYTDKPRAILRELSTNALDAHIAAGKADVPFEVQLPTIWDSTLIVKDYGIGLSPEQITSLYTTYFGSDKSHTNDFVGGLGLGSKSPFAYTDQFTVATRWKGIKHTYTAYISATGVPEIRKIKEEITTETNGLEVHVPVKVNDVATFEITAKKVFEFFEVKPKLNMAINFLEYDKPLMNLITSEGIRCELYKGQDKTMVMQGPIGYPVDRYAVLAGVDYDTKGRDIHGKVNRLLTSGWRLYAPVGTFEITASREGLSYDKKTISRLRKLADDVLQGILVSTRTNLAATTELTTAVELVKNTKPYIVDPVYLNTLTWNGLHYSPADGGFVADLPPDTIVRSIIKKRWGRGKNPHELNILTDTIVMKNSKYRVLWAEKERPYKAYLDEFPPEEDEMVLYFSCPDKLKLDTWLTSLGLPTSTELPKPVRAAPGTRAVNYGATKYSGYCLSSNEWIEATANTILDETNCYLLLDNQYTGWSDTVNLMKEMDILRWPKEEVYVFSIPSHHNKIIKAIQGHNGFITPDMLLDFCIPQDQLMTQIASIEARELTQIYLGHNLSGYHMMLDPAKIESDDLKAFLKEIYVIKDLGVFRYDSSVIQHNLRFLELPFEEDKYKQEVKSIYKSLITNLVIWKHKYGNILDSLREGFQLSCSSWNFDKSPLRDILTDWVNMKLEQAANPSQSQEVA